MHMSRQKQQEVVCNKGVLKKFANFTEKQLLYRAPLGECFWIDAKL